MGAPWLRFDTTVAPAPQRNVNALLAGPRTEFHYRFIGGFLAPPPDDEDQSSTPRELEQRGYLVPIRPLVTMPAVCLAANGSDRQLLPGLKTIGGLALRCVQRNGTRIRVLG